jgi:hypothetical protein
MDREAVKMRHAAQRVVVMNRENIAVGHGDEVD